MTRKKGFIWKYFKEVTTGKYKKDECKFCGEKYITNAVRTENHLLKCKRCTKNKDKNKIKNPPKSSGSKHEPVACSSSSLKTLSQRHTHQSESGDDSEEMNSESTTKSSNSNNELEVTNSPQEIHSENSIHTIKAQNSNTGSSHNLSLLRQKTIVCHTMSSKACKKNLQKQCIRLVHLWLW